MFFKVLFCICMHFILAIETQYFVPLPKKLVFPLDFTNSRNLQCRKDYKLFISSLENNTLWAYRMWDANAKVSKGLTEGSIYQLGYYDECLNIEYPFVTQYCLAQIDMKFNLNYTPVDPFSLEYKPYESLYNKLVYNSDPAKIKRDKIYWGLCVPSSCDNIDVQNAFQNYLNEERNEYIKSYEVHLQKSDCQRKQEWDYSISDYMFCVLIIILAMIVSFSTICDYRYSKHISDQQNDKDQFRLKVLKCFSVRQNFYELSRPDSSNKALNVLYGTRFLLTFSITIGHSIDNMLIGSVFNYEDVEKVTRSFIAMPVAKGDVCVDLFFFISGLLVTYGYLVQTESRFVNPIKAAILRYFRLVPILAVVTYFYATIFYKIGSGPLWNKIIGTEKQYCEKNWWLNLLLLNNYYDVENLCVLQSWYLSTDFQFFLMSIPLNLLIKRNTALSWIFFALILCGSILPTFFLTYFENKDPFFYSFADFFYYLRKNDVFNTVYVKAYTRASSYMLGMILGYIYYRKRESTYKMSSLLSYGSFALSATVITLSIYGGIVFLNPYVPYNILLGALYAALHRPVFLVAAGLMIFTFSFGKIPFIQKFMSWNPFVPLAKLTFGVYMAHMGLQLAKVASRRSPQLIHGYSWITQAVLEMTLALALAFVLYILVENPFIKLLKVLLSSDSKKHAK